MASFAYKAMDKKGKEVNGIVEAESQVLAMNEVKSLGYWPTKITEATASDRRRAGKKTKGLSEFYIGGVKTRELVVFTRQLATLIDAGLPLLRSLNVLHGQLKPCKLRDIIAEISEDVQGGMTFSEGLAKNPKQFDRLFVNMVRAGEIGGMLEVVLNRLADFMEKRQRLIRQVKAAMIYPIAVIIIAAGVVGFLLIKVVPTFAEIFTEFGGSLPWPTMFLIDAANFVGNQWWLILAIVGGAMIFMKLFFKIPIVQSAKDRIVLKVPLVGSLIVKVGVARFARTLGTLITSGVPILQALKIVKETIGNEVIQNAVQNVHDSIRDGDTIAAPLEEAKVFPAMVVNMIDVGEETGNLDAMLLKVADVYDDEVETAVQGMLRLMEPLIIVLLGFVVGFIVISLYLPIFTLADLMSGP